jgi:2-dehydropantoate 2-reductase
VKPHLKIAVVGCGALGSFYGAKLCRAGPDVHFLLRSDYAAVRRRGVLIRSPQGDFRARPRCARAPEQIGPSDLVLIGLKTTANGQFARLLPPLIGPDTAVLTLQNGLGNEEKLAESISPERILGGLCFVCLNRIEPGVIQHLDHGRIVLGEYQRWPEPRTQDFASLFRRAGVPCQVTDNLARAHWEKLVWNIPFNGLGVAGVAGYEAVRQGGLPDSAPRGVCLTTDRLLENPDWERLVRELMREIIAAARALGHGVHEDLEEKMVQNTRTMGPYKASTLIDFERGQPLELDSLFLEPLRQAHQAGVAAPRLAALCGILKKLDPARGNNNVEFQSERG